MSDIDKKNGKAIAVKIAGYIITFIAIGFIVKVIAESSISDITFAHPVASVFLTIILSVVYCFFFSILSYGWILILNFLNDGTVAVSFSAILAVYSKSNIMKYLPGNVMEYIGRNIMGKKLGLSHTDMALASFIETVLLIATAIIVGFIFAYADLVRLVYWILSNFANHSFFFVAAMSSIFFALLILYKTVLYKKMRSYKIGRFLSSRFLLLMIKLFFIYVIVLINLGLTLALIYSLMFDVKLNIADIMRIVSAFTIAWVAGFITPGAPGGMGVKEAGLLLLLAPAFGREITLFAAVIHRFISILGDVLSYLLGRIVLIIVNKSMPKPPLN